MHDWNREPAREMYLSEDVVGAKGALLDSAVRGNGGTVSVFEIGDRLSVLLPSVIGGGAHIVVGGCVIIRLVIFDVVFVGDFAGQGIVGAGISGSVEEDSGGGPAPQRRLSEI